MLAYDTLYCVCLMEKQVDRQLPVSKSTWRHACTKASSSLAGLLQLLHQIPSSAKYVFSFSTCCSTERLLAPPSVSLISADLQAYSLHAQCLSKSDACS